MPAYPAGGPLLIVDDDPKARALLHTLLAEAGYDVVEAGDGSTALSLADETLPALVLLDVVLPGLGGYETCSELRQRFGHELPIVFVSGERVDAHDRTAGLLLGADDYIVKPFSPEELLARVHRLLRRQRHAVRDREADDLFAKLTARELEVLELLADGLDQRDVAEQLVISEKTVGTHIQRALAKLGVHSRTQAVVLTHRRRLALHTERAAAG